MKTTLLETFFAKLISWVTTSMVQIQERGEIVVAMEGTWAPWTYHDESGQLVGYDVEVAQNIAQRLGVEVSFAEPESGLDVPLGLEVCPPF